MEKALIFAIPILLSGACSNQQVYDSLRARNISECRQLPVARQQDCIDNIQAPSYQEYEREIKKAAER